MSINSELLKLSQRPAFQKRVRAEYAAAKKAGRPFGTQSSSAGIGSFSLGSDTDASRAMVDEILKRIRTAIETKFPYIDAKLFRVYGPFEAKDGRDEYRIFFEPDAVHRESLYHEGYPDGLENIILFYSKGMKEPAKNPVWNRAALEWNYNRQTRTLARKMRKQGYMTTYQRKDPQQVAEYRAGSHYFIPAGWKREPDPFLINGIAAINAEMAKDGVTVILDPAYYP